MKIKLRRFVSTKPGPKHGAGFGAAAAFLMLLALYSPAAKAQRDFIDPVQVTSIQLTEAYKSNFSQADYNYTGKLVLVTGRIRSIRTPGQRPYNYQFDKLYNFMTLDGGRGNRPLGIYFWDWEAQRLIPPRFRVGDLITVMGFCQGVPSHLSIIEACVYPNGCGGPKRDFDGPYYELPPSPPPQRR